MSRSCCSLTRGSSNANGIAKREPHKYSSKAEQDEKLAFLLSWVADYYHRGGEMSLRAHQALFESYAGSKQHLRELPIRGLKIGELAI